VRLTKQVEDSTVLVDFKIILKNGVKRTNHICVFKKIRT
jgi:translation initiation factor IF-1